MEEIYTITDEELIDRIDENIGEYELLCEAIPDDCTYDERFYPKRRKVYFEHILNLIKRQQEKIKTLEIEKDDAYQNGFSEGCDYETKIEELAKINEGLQKQVDDLSAKRKRILANKVYSDATLKKWTKDDLIEQIRILEHNWAASEDRFNTSVQNSEKIFYSQGEQIEQLKLELGGYINDQAIWLSKVDALEKENEQLRAMIDYAIKALSRNAESRSQYIEKVKEAFDNCCCEIKPNHGCSYSCEACLASTAADVLDGVLESRTKEIFEKLGKIMHKCNWDWNEPYDTVFGQEVSELAKEYGVNLTK